MSAYDEDQPLPRSPRPARMPDTFIGPEAGTVPAPSGYVLDGAFYPLDHQPPAGVTHGWGNLSWIWWPAISP